MRKVARERTFSTIIIIFKRLQVGVTKMIIKETQKTDLNGDLWHLQDYIYKQR